MSHIEAGLVFDQCYFNIQLNDINMCIYYCAISIISLYHFKSNFRSSTRMFFPLFPMLGKKRKKETP